MEEYIDCENMRDDNCWYLSNRKRFNEYQESYKTVDNEENITLYCDKCIDDVVTVGICDICDKYLLEKWLMIGDKPVCARCIDTENINDNITNLYQVEPKEEDYTIAELYEHRGNLIKYIDGKEIRFLEVLEILIKHIKEGEKERKDEKKRKKKTEEYRRFDNNLNTIKNIMMVTRDCAKKVAKFLNEESIEMPPYFMSRSDLLLWLLEQKRN